MEEYRNLLESGRSRLLDARRSDLSLASRFDLAYNAAHALALAALRRMGYRSKNRITVFNSLPHTLELPPAIWRLLAKVHGIRNAAEYEGEVELDDRLIEELLRAVAAVDAALGAK